MTSTTHDNNQHHDEPPDDVELISPLGYGDDPLIRVVDSGVGPSLFSSTWSSSSSLSAPLKSTGGEFMNDSGNEHDDNHHPSLTLGVKPKLLQNKNINLPPPLPITANRCCGGVSIQRKVLLLLALLLVLFMLSSNDSHELAFVTTFSNHPETFRIYRLSYEVSFLLLCLSFVLYVWEGVPDLQDNVGHLLFAPPPPTTANFQESAQTAYSFVQRRRQQRQHRRRQRNHVNQQNGRNNGLSNDVEEEANTNDYDIYDISLRPPLQAQDNDDDDDDDDDDDNDFIKEKKESINNHVEIDNDVNEEKWRRRITKEDEGYHGIRSSSSSSSLMHRHQQPLASTHLLFAPPSSTSVLGAALDFFTLTCASILLCTTCIISSSSTVGYDATFMQTVATIMAPLFPLVLLIFMIIISMYPWTKRKSTWTIMCLTVGAPFHEVTFRDGFVGDVLTSTVRPLQDLVTIVFNLPGRAAWRGILTSQDIATTSSWALHTIVLPGCTLSPLWWRFLQNLRQCYDAKCRWPYLGNATKYLLAAEVSTFAMFDPSIRQHPVWIICFLVTTLYQIWWDVFMDWGLLELNTNYGYNNNTCYSNNNESKYYHQLFWWWPYTLRPRRLYAQIWIYYVIFGLNFCLRFVSMITLIPQVYLSRTTGLIVNTYTNPNFQLFAGSLAASAEIFRRTIWSLLRLEWEVIKATLEREKKLIHNLDDLSSNYRKIFEDKEDMTPMKISSGSIIRGSDQYNWRALSFVTLVRGSSSAFLSDMSNLNDIQILSELCVWATVFSGVAIVAAAHREVL